MKALITGSTSGIGLGIAKKLAHKSFDIFLNGFGDVKEIENTRKSIEEEYKVKCVYLGHDLSKPSEIKKMFDEINMHGGVDVLVNNAGIQYVSSVDEFPEDKWESIMSINLNSNFYCIKYALPNMKNKKWGRIINIASVHGLVASPFKSAYVAAKHGVIGLTKSVALELAPTTITCNAICPGYVLTPLVEGQIESQAKVHNLPREKVIEEVILAAQPKKEFIRVEQIADMCVFMCSDSASTMTGSVITMDGAWTAR